MLNVSIRPNRIPPSIAPAMLPRPPSVAATKPFNPVTKPISKNAKNMRPEHDAGRARHHSGDCERVSHHPRQVRAHELRGFRILGDRLHDDPGARVLEEELQRDP